MEHLERPTLVLNKSWTAIHITTVKRALVLLYIEAAKAIDPITYETFDFERWAALDVNPDEECVKTPHGMVKSPHVVVLTNYNKMPIIEASLSKKNIYRRDDHTCQYCEKPLSKKELSVDHIMPTSRGGITSWENCVLACKPCNHTKSDRTPTEAGMKLTKTPRKPAWIHILVKCIDGRDEWKNFVKVSS